MSFLKKSHPWNPGYVIPDYVLAEPPERGTFTTQWLPRGTIPQLLPDYLAKPLPINIVRCGSSLSEQTLARNSLFGTSLSGHSLGDDTLGAQAYELEPLGAAPKSWDARATAYGQKVARTLMGQMRRMPEKMRGPAMKKAMKAIDPTLQSRAEAYAVKLKRSGVPASVALERGIAQAASEGAVSELTKLGRRSRVSPQSRSLRGLGRSRMALGAVPKGTQVTTDAMVAAAALITGSQAPPQVGQCSSDGVYIWAVMADGTGYWRRRTVQDVCVGAYAGPGPDVTVHEAGEQAKAAPTLEMVSVGPFFFPKEGSATVMWNMGVPLPADVIKAVKFALTSSTMRTDYPQLDWGWRLSPFIPGIPRTINGNYLQMISGFTPDAVTIRDSRQYPVIKAKHPVTGKDYGVFVSVVYARKDLPEFVAGKDYNPDNPPRLAFSWAEILPVNRSWYEKIWDGIAEFFAGVKDVLKDVLDAVGGVACDMLGQPGATEAAAKSGNIYLTAGTVVADKVCKKEEPPPVPPSTGGSWLVPVAIAGAGGLLLLMLARRRH